MRAAAAEWAAGAPPGGVDLVVGLHACGGLTDAALAAAIRLGGALVVVPCCYGKHGRLGDWLPSAAAVGCPPDTPPEAAAGLLCRLAESPDRQVSVRAMRVVAALRLAAVRRGLDARPPPPADGGAPWGSGPWHLELAEFDEAASFRNLALIGCPV